MDTEKLFSYQYSMLFCSACHFSYVEFCFLVQYISNDKITLLEAANVLPLLQTPFWIVIGCTTQFQLPQLIGITRLFTFIWTKIHPALPGSRLTGTRILKTWIFNRITPLTFLIFGSVVIKNISWLSFSSYFRNFHNEIHCLSIFRTVKSLKVGNCHEISWQLPTFKLVALHNIVYAVFYFYIIFRTVFSLCILIKRLYIVGETSFIWSNPVSSFLPRQIVFIIQLSLWSNLPSYCCWTVIIQISHPLDLSSHPHGVLIPSKDCYYPKGVKK